MKRKKRKSKSPRKVGRQAFKLKDAEIKQLEQLATIGCTNDEIAAVIGCSWDTLYRNYAEVIKTGRNQRNVSLRHMQFKIAQSGNVGMLIWLGKQYLGQTEKTDMPSLEKLVQEYLKLTPDERLRRTTAIINPEGKDAPGRVADRGKDSVH